LKYNKSIRAESVFRHSGERGCRQSSKVLCAGLQIERAIGKNLEARGGFEPPIKVLQTFALPLGYRATTANAFYQMID
jgi:hypothetical protein